MHQIGLNALKQKYNLLTEKYKTLEIQRNNDLNVMSDKYKKKKSKYDKMKQEKKLLQAMYNALDDKYKEQQSELDRLQNERNNLQQILKNMEIEFKKVQKSQNIAKEMNK